MLRTIDKVETITSSPASKSDEPQAQLPKKRAKGATGMPATDPNYPIYVFQQRRQAQIYGPVRVQRGARSGYGHLAIFSDIDEKPRLANDMEFLGCSGKNADDAWRQFPSGTAIIAMDESLSDIATKNPCSDAGDCLRLSIAQGLKDEDVWRDIPPTFRNIERFAKTVDKDRPWNWLQAAKNKEKHLMKAEQDMIDHGLGHVVAAGEQPRAKASKQRWRPAKVAKKS